MSALVDQPRLGVELPVQPKLAHVWSIFGRSEKAKKDGSPFFQVCRWPGKKSRSGLPASPRTSLQMTPTTAHSMPNDQERKSYLDWIRIVKTSLQLAWSFFHHFQGSIDFNTANTNCPKGMYIIHPAKLQFMVWGSRAPGLLGLLGLLGLPGLPGLPKPLL